MALGVFLGRTGDVEEIVQVMEEVMNGKFVTEDPLKSVSHTVKDEGTGAKAERKDTLIVKLASPMNTEEMPVFWTNGA